jgi:hypothetical protein
MPPSQGGSQASMQLPTQIIRVGENSLWSAFQFADTTVVQTTDNRIFSTQLGAVGQGFAVSLSIAETNMKEAGRLPSGLAFDCQGIALQAYYKDSRPIDGADIRNVVNNVVLRWDYLQTLIDISPAVLIGAGGGVFGDTADTGAAEGGSGGSRINLNNGNGQCWIYQQYPVLLSANTTFSQIISWGRFAIPIDGGLGNSDLIIRSCLLGWYKTALPSG